MRIILYSAFWLVIYFVHATSFAQVDEEIDDAPNDFQWLANEAKWKWEDRVYMPPCRVDTIPNEQGVLVYTVLRENRVVYSFKGHQHTVFGRHRGLSNRLYFVDHSMTKPGGQMVALSLVTGKEVWRTDLEALGESNDVQEYRNRLNLDVNPNRIIISGKETVGCYIEVKNIKTGETIGHRIYGDDETEPDGEKPPPIYEQATTGETDFEKPIAEWDWHWEPFVGMLSCMAETKSKFKVRVEWSQNGQRFFSIFENEREIGSWKIHPYTDNLFRITDNRLYIAFWDQDAVGSEIAAIDLETGKEIWRSKTKALNAKDRWRYQNYLNLNVTPKGVVIWGWETEGRYVELKSLTTGETIEQKMFERK